MSEQQLKLSREFNRGAYLWWLTAIVLLVLAIGLSTGARGESVDGAGKLAVQFNDIELKRILRMSPLPELVDDPSNAVANNKRAAKLGKLLFFDQRLSIDGQTSCATCHDPQRHWTDGRRTSDPKARFPKNVPSLWNTAFNRWFFWDGRADSAWAQALGPIEQEGELSSNRLHILHLVYEQPTLHSLYVEVFGAFPRDIGDNSRFPLNGRPVLENLEHPLHRAWASMSDEDRHSATLVFTNIGKAIAAFERQIIVRDTRIDRYVDTLRTNDHDGSTAILSNAEARGLKLFVGRGNCTLCHSGPLLSDSEFHDVGIALGQNRRIDPGRHRGTYKLLRSPFTRIGRYADVVTQSAPVNFLEQQGHQLGQFKTPSLRGVADTAPYMHDGRFETLEEVVRFYVTRDGALPIGHPTTLLQPLDLNDEEINDLAAFLGSLSNLNQSAIIEE